jgi:hypothetical protein
MNYIARFKDDKGMIHSRRYMASHAYHAHRKATAIAKSHGWRVESVGSV